MCRDASPDLLQQDGELEVGTKELADSPEAPHHFTFGWRMTVDGVVTAQSSQLLSPASTSPCNSWTWHCLHVQVTLRKGLDGATEDPLNSKERTAKEGAYVPQRKLAMQQASQTEMSHT